MCAFGLYPYLCYLSLACSLPVRFRSSLRVELLDRKYYFSLIYDIAMDLVHCNKKSIILHKKGMTYDPVIRIR